MLARSSCSARPVRLPSASIQADALRTVGQKQRVADKLVEWSGGFPDWFLSDELRIHATGGRRFIAKLIRELGMRRVVRTAD